MRCDVTPGPSSRRCVSGDVRGARVTPWRFPRAVLEWSDEKYSLLRRVLARRQTFFEDIRALTRYMVFESWDQLMAFMIRGLDLQPQVDTG